MEFLAASWGIFLTGATVAALMCAVFGIIDIRFAATPAGPFRTIVRGTMSYAIPALLLAVPLLGFVGLIGFAIPQLTR